MLKETFHENMLGIVFLFINIFHLPLSLQYCIIYFVMGLFPEYGADQMMLAVRLHTSLTFTSRG